ncbi:MAG: hypothetical protein Salg2KO_01570 [Salibacteraceae bacterium]
MKDIRYLLTLTLLIGVACDKVEIPIEKPAVVNPIDTTEIFPEIDTAEINDATRKVLVEEFTGHKCPNCPLNTSKLLKLQERNDPEVVVISYHHGIFSKTDDEAFEADYTTEYGGELHDLFGINAYPTAIVNRATFEGFDPYSNTFPTHTFWKDPIDLMLVENEPILAIGIANEFQADSNQYKIRVSLKALEDLNQEYRLTLLYIEDSVISPQIDNRIDKAVDPDQTDMEYAHKHLFRAPVNANAGISGEVIVTNDGLSAEDWVDWRYVFPVPEYIEDPLNCTFIALVVESATSEVIQVEEVHAHAAEEE